ncbi:MAG TPA: hypothetical protein VJJ46_09095, partial [Anaerolineales bacterium]|nr:hypothetical protein [Anaerolineales bacterium]
MRRFARAGFVAAILLSLGSPLTASAQDYSFSLDQETVDVYWELDGTARIEYEFVFTNDSFAPPMAYLDVGVPADSYSIPSVRATIDGRSITDIQLSPYVDPGVALGLGSASIQPGGRGVVRVSIPGVGRVLYEGDEAGYASAQFSPTWFDASLVHGTTDLTVTFHFPPGVQPEEPRYYPSPSGWPETQPAAAYDDNGRIIYRWHNAQANGYTQ